MRKIIKALTGWSPLGGNGNGQARIKCTDCNGSGTDPDGDECRNCSGQGWF